MAALVVAAAATNEKEIADTKQIDSACGGYGGLAIGVEANHTAAGVICLIALLTRRAASIAAQRVGGAFVFSPCLCR